MTNIDYPLSIRTALLNGNNRQQAASFITTESRSGKTYFKRIAQDQNTYMNVNFRFNDFEAIVFQDWFRSKLKMGFLPFNMDLLTEWGKVNYECRFIPDSLLPVTKETPVWAYSAVILIYNYGPPDWLPSGIADFPQYFTAEARAFLDVIINQQFAGGQ